MIIGVDVKLLDGFKLKANRRNRGSYPLDKINTVKIYKTTQSSGDGINIDLRVSELRDYANANVYLIGNELLILPVRHYESESFRVSLNRDNSKLCTIKIGGKDNVNKITKYLSIDSNKEYTVYKMMAFEYESDLFYYSIEV